MNLIPAVNDIKVHNGEYILPREIGFSGVYPSSDSVFLERLQKVGKYSGTVKPEKDVEVIATDAEDEEYRLDISDSGISIYCSGKKGYNLALTTVYQLAVFGKGILPCCTINDKPRFKVRSLMLDVCRHFFAVSEVKKIIEQCALLKMNRLHLCLSQDQGYRLESERYPELNKISSLRRLSPQDPLVVNGKAEGGDVYGGYYTKKQIKEIVNFASVRGIEIVPELNIPGHASAILAAFPELTCSGKPLKVKGTFGVHDRLFCAGNENALKFILNLVDEICEMFPSEYFCLGGDEAPKSEWKACPKCNALMGKYGIENYAELQTYFINQVIKHLESKGKTVVVWNESAASGNLDGSAVVQYWMDNGSLSNLISEIEKGRKFLLSDMGMFYCDYSYAEIPLRATLMYEPKLKGVNLPESGVEGIEAMMWTEWTPENEDIEKMMYPRLLAVAECGWTKKRSYGEFTVRAEKFLNEKPLNLLQPTHWDETTVSGDKALEIIVKNMTTLGAKVGGMREYGEEEGGKAVFVESDHKGQTQAPVDPRQMIYSIMADKLRGAYSEDDILKVVDMIIEIKRKG